MIATNAGMKKKFAFVAIFLLFFPYPLYLKWAIV